MEKQDVTSPIHKRSRLDLPLPNCSQLRNDLTVAQNENPCFSSKETTVTDLLDEMDELHALGKQVETDLFRSDEKHCGVVQNEVGHVERTEGEDVCKSEQVGLLVIDKEKQLGRVIQKQNLNEKIIDRTLEKKEDKTLPKVPVNLEKQDTVLVKEESALECYKKTTNINSFDFVDDLSESAATFVTKSYKRLSKVIGTNTCSPKNSANEELSTQSDATLLVNATSGDSITATESETIVSIADRVLQPENCSDVHVLESMSGENAKENNDGVCSRITKCTLNETSQNSMSVLTETKEYSEVDAAFRVETPTPDDTCVYDHCDTQHPGDEKENVCSANPVINCEKRLLSEEAKAEVQVNDGTAQISQSTNPVCDRQAVVYLYSDKLMLLCDSMIRVPGRACMVHRLIESYGLLKYLSIVPPGELKRDEILQFHSEEYVEVLERLDKVGEEGYDDQTQTFGLGYDCPAEPGVYEYATSAASATVTAAQSLVDGICRVAINWFGGWHHAKKDEASGFCYINDIVLGILKLREKYQKVLYIDLDLHHGDGVEDAFTATSKVFTVSFHKYSVGFFPGTGSLTDVGVGKGKFFSLNIPLHDGIQDQQFFSIFSSIVEKVREVYCPEAVVCQCGADGLVGDPMNSFNLTHLSLGRCVYSLLQWKIPLLLLGGGGYNHANTARCWTFITSLAVSKKLPVDIPDHEHFTEYGPTYELDVTPGYRKNMNTSEYLRGIYRKVLGILQRTGKVLSDKHGFTDT